MYKMELWLRIYIYIIIPTNIQSISIAIYATNQLLWTCIVLNSKTLRPVTAKQKSIESKKVIFYVTTSGIGGLYILKVLHNPKSATIIINVGYIARLVSWVNANMYLSSSCEVKMSDNGFDVTITTDQIDGTENFSCTCVGIG